jgi:hypothetical protein
VLVRGRDDWYDATAPMPGRSKKRRLARGAMLVALSCAAALSCTMPIVVGPVEASLEACRNGLDDDGNGLIDCEDAGCAQGGFCTAFETSCGVLPQSGCPRGMACYANENEQHGSLCSLPGTKGLDEPCAGAAGCRSGLHCLGVCRSTCLDNHQCPGDTFCIRTSKSEFGTCSVPCIPAFGGHDCRAGTCVTAHAFLASFDGNQVIAFCADEPAWKGGAKEGEACDDPPRLSNLPGMCEHGLVCVPLPDASGPVCHSTCGLSGEKVSLDCLDPSKRCIAAFPLDPRPRLDRQLVAGLCITP